MYTRIIRIFMLAAIAVLALGTYTPALADQPMVLEFYSEYNFLWFSCGDFDIQAVGIHSGEAKVKVDEQFNILRNNAQTRDRGIVINTTTGKYLIEDELWTWNMHFENNISTKSVLAGRNWTFKYPDGRMVWQDNGVEKFVGIYVNLLTEEIIFTNPYHVSGQKPDYDQLADTLCAALR